MGTSVEIDRDAAEDLMKDGWTDISQRLSDKVLSNPGQEFACETFIAADEDSEDEKTTGIRSLVDALVTDASTAGALKPGYRRLCERPCFHDGYLDANNDAGTHLVDTNGRGIERIDATGVWADGEHYELDRVIYASGFEVGTELSRRSGFETVGRSGELLSDHWAEGMRSLHGIHVHGFSTPDCTPGYYNNEGQSSGRRGALNSMGYPDGPVAYFQCIDQWRSSGHFEGLELQP